MEIKPFNRLPAKSSRAVAAPRQTGVAARKNWRRWILLGLTALLLVPPMEVAAVRFVDPPATPLMGVRWLQDRLAGVQRPRVLYSWLAWRELPELFLKAAWVSEDQRFFQHHGFDWIELRRAIAKARARGGDPRGSSTISMQCARSLFLWQGHSYVRKALEAYYTVWMEAMLSKRRIFVLYANVVELGRGVYGVEAASRYYYGVPARRLTGDQAAMLAALLPAPRKWDPRRPGKRLLMRQQRILRELPAVRWPGL